jgi:Aminoglycoside-2''-adenylyltransferase
VEDAVDIPSRSLDELFAVCRFLADFPCRWWLGGGWAIDAWFGTQSREHEDIEICVARQDQDTIFAYCAAWQFFTPVNNQWASLPSGERLAAPRFMLQLQRTRHTIDLVEGMPPTFEFLLNEVADDHRDCGHPNLPACNADLAVSETWPSFSMLYWAAESPNIS